MNWQVQIQSLSNSIQEALENATIVPYPRHPPIGGPQHGICLAAFGWKALNRVGERPKSATMGSIPLARLFSRMRKISSEVPP